MMIDVGKLDRALHVLLTGGFNKPHLGVSLTKEGPILQFHAVDVTTNHDMLICNTDPENLIDDAEDAVVSFKQEMS